MEQPDVQTPEIKKPILDIQPRELKFIFEVKKQSSCAVSLINVTDQYVAFKIKTTSPRKYCVRPNVGVIKPNSTFDFTVTMQAQKSAPSDMLCKDKFLVQSTIAPFGTTEEEITPDMFSKESGKYVEECKLRVFLTIPSSSPAPSPINGVSKQEQSCLTRMEEDKPASGVENLSPVQPANNCLEEKVAMGSKENVQPHVKFNEVVESRPLCDVEGTENKLSRDVEETEKKLSKDVEGTEKKVSRDDDEGTEKKLARDVEGAKDDEEGIEKRLARDVEQLKSRVARLDSELSQAQSKIEKLTEENTSSIKENQTLKKEVVSMRTKMGIRSVERGFPPLFVCMVALISLTVGFLLHS